MHSQDALYVDDPALTGTGRMTAYEYDGLEAGELAWIMSKQFTVRADPVRGDPSNPNNFTAISSPIDFSTFASNVDRLEDAIRRQGATPDGWSGVGPNVRTGDDNAALAPQKAFSGFGPDRMQRLAYTKWVESFFKYRVGRQSLDLTKVAIAGTGALDQVNAQRVLDSEIDYFARLAADGDAPDDGQLYGPVAGASLFSVPDLAWGMQKARVGDELQVQVPMMQGLYVMEKGPFLRSYGVDHYPVDITLPLTASRENRWADPKDAKFDARTPKTATVDRHIGSDLAQRALMAELKQIGIFNWVPDGITLSKLANGPDGVADAEFDSRAGQLFNIGVQGPCITKSWTGNTDLAVLPMDKVFILVVASLDYEVGSEVDDMKRVAAAFDVTENLEKQRFRAAYLDLERVKNGAAATAKSVDARAYAGKTANEANDAEERANAVEASARYCVNQVDEAKESIKAIKGPTAQQEAYATAVKEIRTAELAQPNTQEFKDAIAAAQAAVRELKNPVGEARRLNVLGKSFQQTAAELRNGSKAVKRAVLKDFRLVRGTSSWLANKSHFDPKKPTSRCGLPIGWDGSSRGAAEYILGGWSIGTVVDSAASRALGHNGVRTAPASMAINVNVNVEWWSADKLYSHYQDKERGRFADKPESTVNMRTASNMRTAEMVASEENPGEQVTAAAVVAGQSKLTSGNEDVEGTFKQADPLGPDTDPDGLGVFDLAGKPYKVDQGDGVKDSYDSRVWTYKDSYRKLDKGEKQPDSIEVRLGVNAEDYAKTL